MNKHWLAAGVTAALVAGAFAIRPRPAAAEDDTVAQLHWHTDRDAAFELARKTGKPLLFVFR